MAEEQMEPQLRTVRDSYASQLPRRFAQIDEAWRGARAGDMGALRFMWQRAHDLTASCASFGFISLCQAMQRLEQMLKSQIAGGEPPNPAQVAQIDALLQLAANTSRLPQDTLPVNGHAPPLPRQESRLVYLVEYDADLAQQLKTQLGHFGYSVKIFRRLDEISAALDNRFPAAMIVDSAASRGCCAGADAILALRRAGEVLPPVIFISDRQDFITRLQAVRVDGAAFFTKPVEIGSLIDTLDLLTTTTRPEPFRVLIVEDSPTLASLYAHTLELAGMVTRQVTDPLRIMDMLADFSPELILVDIYMPGASGEEVAKVLRQQEAFVSTPIVFLSGETDTNRQMAALGLGADDFLVKPIEPEHLVASVTSRIERYRVLRGFIVRDSLTGLLNHTKTKEQLDVEMARAQRQQRPMSFAMIDLDHFKRVNDNYGHSTGDRVLKSLARLLQQRLRKVDIVGRYGGEEFAVILTDTDGRDAVRVLDGIRKDMGEVRQRWENTDFSVTFSCGIASFPDFATPEAISNAADQALYRAKQGGRNRVVLAAATNPNTR